MKKSIKTIGLVSVLILLLSVFPQTVKAVEFSDGLENEIGKLCDADKIKLPDGIENPDKTGGDFDLFSKITSLIHSALFSALDGMKKLFFMLCALIIVFALTKHACALNPSPVLQSITDTVGIIALSVTVFSVMRDVFYYIQSTLLTLCGFISAYMPVTASLSALSGNIAAGATGASLMLLFNEGIFILAKEILLPGMMLLFAFSFISAIPGINIRSLTGLIKNSLTTLLAFVFTAFSAILYFQTQITAASDNFAYRTVRFASGVFIPVIGGVIGDASRTVAAGVATVKASLGFTALVVLLSLLIPPIVRVVIFKLIILSGAIFSAALGCDTQSRYLYDLNGILSVLFAAVIGVCAVFAVSCAIFIKTGAGG